MEWASTLPRRAWLIRNGAQPLPQTFGDALFTGLFKIQKGSFKDDMNTMIVLFLKQITTERLIYELLIKP